jgi:hypothetical protein
MPTNWRDPAARPASGRVKTEVKEEQEPPATRPSRPTAAKSHPKAKGKSRAQFYNMTSDESYMAVSETPILSEGEDL